MSLRQRGQRASESTNEGSTVGGVYNSSPSSGGGSGYGYGASPSSTAASSGGGVNNTKNANPYGGGYYGAPPTSTSSGGGGGYNYNNSPSAVGGGDGGGGVAATNSNYGAAPTPRGYPTASAGYGGAYTTVSNNNNNNPAVASPYASSSSSSNNMSGYSAAYNSGGYGGSPYGTTVTAGSISGYGGYSISNNNNSSGAGASAGSPNPFHTSNKKFNLGSITSNILPLLFGLVICTLTATTIHFRRSMQRTYTQIELSKQTIQKHHQLSKQRFQSNLDQLEKDRASLAESNHGLERKLKQLKVLHRELSEGHSNSIDQLDAKEAEKQSILKKIDVVKYRLEDTKEELEMYTSMVKGKAEVEEYSKKRENALWEVVGRLESRIGRESWREAEEWFGPGPHKVEIDLEYPLVTNTDDPPSSWPLTRNRIMLEMAPLDLMPHSVNLFLQQVHHGLWDGNELTANPEHIMSFGYHRASAHEGFVDMALETVSYQEYSAKYPHLQWSVGFMGRPSGPDFYINKKDNTIAHGPGGQENTDDMHNEADPCFARVVEGVNVLNEIDKIPVDKNHGSELVHPVKIVSARVMAQRNENSIENQGGGGAGDGSWEEVEHGRKLDGGDKIMPLPTDENDMPRAYQ